MRTLISYILIVLGLCSCDDPYTGDCFMTTGDIKDYEIKLEGFDRIFITSNIDVYITQDVEQRVVLSTGENIFDEMSINVVDGELMFDNNNSCNWSRGYGTSSLHITVPDLKQIKYEGGATIRSTNTLAFDTLTLNSLASSGDYVLNIQSDELNVVTKRISNFYVTGNVVDLNLNFQGGDGRFYGENLMAQNIQFYHNGTNDILVHPVLTLEGVIDRYGDVIYYNEPTASLQVEAYSKGKLIRQF